MLKLNHVSRTFNPGTVNEKKALNDLSLHLAPGDFATIVGSNGAGKSTLFGAIAGSFWPDTGSVVLDGQDITFLPAHVRSKQIGFIFQGFNLLPKLSALENVELPMIYQGVRATERKKRAVAALERVGLGGRMKHRPNQLSGGQQQRCAIARAIAVNPSLILADEPTGNLDQKTGREILNIFDELHQAGNTIVLITHDPKVALCGQRMIRIEDGRLYEPKEADADDLSVV